MPLTIQISMGLRHYQLMGNLVVTEILPYHKRAYLTPNRALTATLALLQPVPGRGDCLSAPNLRDASSETASELLGGLAHPRSRSVGVG